MNFEIRRLRKIKKTQWDKPVRRVEKFDFTGIIENSPVEAVEGGLYCDLDDHMVYACFGFRNVGSKAIKKLDIRILCYYNQNIPFIKLPFSYSFEEGTFGMRIYNGEKRKTKDYVEDTYIRHGEFFGDLVYIKVPDRYISKMELEISGARYSDGTYEKVGCIANTKYKKIKQLDDNKRFAYNITNKYQGSVENAFPSIVVPSQGEYTWLCCCGSKNLNKDDVCLRCSRDKAWQMSNDMDQAVEQVKYQYNLYDKTKYSQTKYMVSQEKREILAEEQKKAKENVERQQARKEREKWSLLPMILAISLGIYLFSQLMYFVFGFLLPRLTG